MSSPLLPATLLLLGSGELGKELAIAGQRLGCRVVAVDSYAGAPAMQVADEALVIPMTDAAALKQRSRPRGQPAGSHDHVFGPLRDGPRIDSQGRFDVLWKSFARPDRNEVQGALVEGHSGNWLVGRVDERESAS